PPFGEKLRSDQVPERVIDALEVIQIDKYHGEFVTVTLRAVNLRLQNKIHVPRVIQAGAIGREGELVDALHVARIFQSDGGEIRQGFEQRQIALHEALPFHAIDQLDDAQA